MSIILRCPTVPCKDRSSHVVQHTHLLEADGALLSRAPPSAVSVSVNPAVVAHRLYVGRWLTNPLHFIPPFSVASIKSSNRQLETDRARLLRALRGATTMRVDETVSTCRGDAVIGLINPSHSSSFL